MTPPKMSELLSYAQECANMTLPALLLAFHDKGPTDPVKMCAYEAQLLEMDVDEYVRVCRADAVKTGEYELIPDVYWNTNCRISHLNEFATTPSYKRPREIRLGQQKLFWIYTLNLLKSDTFLSTFNRA